MKTGSDILTRDPSWPSRPAS